MPISRKPSQTFRKNKRESEIKFSVKSRFEYLEGFQKRKEDRRKKGNLINLKKEQRRKREEASSYKQHVQTEYQKAVDAIRHNQGPCSTASQSEGTVLESAVTFYPAVENLDPFGEVSVQISSLESPHFSRSASDDIIAAKDKIQSDNLSTKSSSKKLPTFASFKKLARSSKFLQKKRSKSNGLKRVKASRKDGKKKTSK